MSNRTMLEINHDTTPHGRKERERWVNAMCDYLSSADPKLLPHGVTFFGMRHHTEECPLGEPPRGWNNAVSYAQKHQDADKSLSAMEREMATEAAVADIEGQLQPVYRDPDAGGDGMWWRRDSAEEGCREFVQRAITYLQARNLIESRDDGKLIRPKCEPLE